MAELNPADDLPARLAWRASAHPHAAAFLQKRHGVWRRWTWGEVADAVRAASAGLLAAGLARGEAVGIVSGARVEAVCLVHACQRAGLVPVLLSAGLAPGALATLSQQAGVVAFVAEDQEQVDKIADVQSRLAALRRVWVIDPKGTQAYRHIQAVPAASLTDGAAGPASGGTAPAGAARSKGAATALGLFSAGVFSEPRHVPVSPEAVMLLAAAQAPLALAEGERVVSLFGLADPLGHYFAVVAPVLAGSVACFGEDRVPSVAEMRQCAPQTVAAPARLLDRLRREAAARASRSGGWQQRLIQRWAATQTPSAPLRWLVGQPVANTLGLGACRQVLTGYDRMAPSTARFLARLGLATRGLYAVAEAAGPVGAFAQADAPAIEVFEAYRPTVDADGRLALSVQGQRVSTGDLVSLDGGRLHLIGRAADLLTLPGGQQLAPSVIEAEIGASPFVNQAVAVGGPASGITALIELDEVALRDWAASHGLAFTTLRSLAESSEVARLVEQARSEASQRLEAAHPGAGVRRVVLLPRALDAGNGELSPSLALRRAIVRNRYAHRLVGTAPVPPEPVARPSPAGPVPALAPVPLRSAP
jgi:long-chain acyl-CoA synthetase